MYNDFMVSMTANKNAAIKGVDAKAPCAEEIIPMIEDFFKKSMNVNIKWDGSMLCWHMDQITEIVRYLAQNTRNYEKLNAEDVTFLKKIFGEIDALQDEVLQFYSPSNCENDFNKRILCIKEIVYKNMVGMHDSEEEHDNYRDGMIFQSYENLWKIIHRVNIEWNELRNRGFSINVFNDYFGSFKYDRTVGSEMSEEEKFESFMEVLDGKKKFVPIYEKRPVSFKVVDNDFEGEFFITVENKKPYRMRQDGETV